MRPRGVDSQLRDKSNIGVRGSNLENKLVIILGLFLGWGRHYVI